jgi:transcriptional regulator with XRE-family HTH domain
VNVSITHFTAAAVRAEAARSDVSLRALATQLGWSHGYLQRRTSGQVPFRVDELDAIATALGVPINTFVSAA